MILKCKVGEICKAYRKSIKLTQTEVSIDTGYSIENVSSFETGRNDNYILLLWYIKKGLPVEDLVKKGVFEV